MSSNRPPAATYSRTRLNHTAAASGTAAPPPGRAPMRQARARTMAIAGDAADHDADHQRGERADEQAAAEQHAGHRGGADAGPPGLLDHHQQRRAGQRVADLVLRLVQQDPLQAIDRQRAEHPATHGVDVEVTDQRERPVLPPQVEQRVQALWTREQHGHHAADQGRRQRHARTACRARRGTPGTSRRSGRRRPAADGPAVLPAPASGAPATAAGARASSSATACPT